MRTSKTTLSIITMLLLILGSSFIFNVSADTPPLRTPEELLPPPDDSGMVPSMYTIFLKGVGYYEIEVYLHNFNIFTFLYKQLDFIEGLEHLGLLLNPDYPYEVVAVRINYGSWLLEDDFSKLYAGHSLDAFTHVVEHYVKRENDRVQYYADLKAHYEYLEWEYPANYPDPYIPFFPIP